MLFAENHLASWEQMTGCNIRFIHHADIISHGVSILQAADTETRRTEAWTEVNIEKNLTILNMHVGRVKFESHGNSLSGMYSSQMFLHNFYNIHHTMQNSILLPKQHSQSWTSGWLYTLWGDANTKRAEQLKGNQAAHNTWRWGWHGGDGSAHGAAHAGRPWRVGQHPPAMVAHNLALHTCNRSR